MTLLNHVNANTESIITESSNNAISGIDQIISKLTSHPEYSSLFKKFFPKTTSKYGIVFAKSNSSIVLSSVFGNTKVTKSSKLNSSFRSIIDSNKSNVSPSIQIIGMPEVNAFTIPGLYGEMDLDTSIGHILYGRTPIIKGSRGKNGLIKLTNSTGSNISPFIFFTGNLIKSMGHLTPLDLNMISLHELGHWDYNRKILSTALETYSVFAAPISLLLGLGNITGLFNVPALVILLVISIVLSLVLRSSLSKYEEFRADKLAKSLGYGVDLSDALRNLDFLHPASTKSDLNKVSSLAEKLSIFTDILATHPSTYRRSNRLLESDIFMEGDNPLQISTLSPIVSKLDSIISNRPFMPKLALFSGK